MTSTDVAKNPPLDLPATGDENTWTDRDRALIEASGLTTKQGQRVILAPRPVIEAFLVHCRNTGLNPIARQIYCIERGGKWGTQVSIDGARLVAERSGQYRGQTPIEWTSDGVTWSQVWLSKDNPAAARVGIYREGFAEPMMAVATWDAYQAGGPMWRKMPALMLGKCAEMLGLRRAFPQELSGLYSTEEMAQASTPSQGTQAAVAPAPAAAPAAAQRDPNAPAHDWFELGRKITFLGQPGEGGLRDLFQACKNAGDLGKPIEEGSDKTFGDFLLAQSAKLPETAPDEPAADEPGDVVVAELMDDEPAADTATGEVK